MARGIWKAPDFSHTQARPRIFFLRGLPPFAFEWRLQSGLN
jgi:hypothetical protein